MHNPDYTPNSTLNNLGTNHFGSTQIQFKFTPNQENSTTLFSHTNHKLSDLIADKIQRKEFFYGVEVSAHSFGTKKTVLDYNIFGSMLPLFTSIIWFGTDYAQIERVTDVEAIRSGRALESRTNVLPHFTAYRVDRDRLKEFLELNFRNVLALRGDQFDLTQEFKHATEMVAKIRELRGDSISIGVGGYPEGHIDSKNLDEDIEFLAQKVNAGADFIITQVCFSSEAVISFVRRCREKGIKVPIIIGVLVPDNLRILKRMMDITGATLPAAEMDRYKKLSHNTSEFHEYSVDAAANMITQVLSSDLDIYGVHFFTMNRFKNVQKVLQRLTEKNFKNEVERWRFTNLSPEIVMKAFEVKRRCY